MLAYRYRHCGIGLCQNISPMPLAKNRTDFLRTAMRVLRSNNFARRIQSFPWELILPHHLIITNAKRTARFFPRCPLIFFLYLILPIAHKEVRRVVPTVRMLAYRHRHCGIGLCQNISPMPLAKKPYRFFANSHARVAQQQFRAAYSIIPVETDTATSFNYHKRKTDGKVLSPLSAYVSLLYFNTANRPQRSSTCSTSRSNARTPPPPSRYRTLSKY